MTWIGPYTMYAHAETDEEPLGNLANDLKSGLSELQIYSMNRSNPLYEVAFEFYVNDETSEYVLTKVDTGQQVLTGPVPRGGDRGIPFGDPEDVQALEDYHER